MLIRHILCVNLLVLVAAKTPVTRPTTLTDPATCVSSECHTPIKAFTVVHGPVSANSCEACHQLKDAEQHSFALRTGGSDLCTYCHEFSVKGLAVVHEPVTRGECLGCHDPHGGKTKALVRENSMKNLCYRCHESVTRDIAFMHAPVEQGACDSCHAPHAARFPKLLDAVGSDLCLACHTDFEHRMGLAPVRHKAMQEGCEKCHAAHGGAYEMSLRQQAPELCLGCHKALNEQMQTATVQHSAAEQGRACLNCHSAHFSSIAKLQPQQTLDLCMKCHDKTQKKVRGAVLAVAEVSDAKLLKHGQIKDGQCAGCHDVHGARHADLLKNTFNTGYYKRFAVENYALCFGCHDTKLVMEPKTKSMTAFRNGDVNLHFVHADKDERDKSCRVCHVAHASAAERLIRPWLSYGLWQMPMRFTKTPTGGSCSPGCHQKLDYDRENPVPPTTAPAPREVPLLARAQHQEDRVINWTATDRAGAIVQIPDGMRPTVIVLIGNGQADVVQHVIQALPKNIDAQMIIVTCGQGAAELATTLDADRSAWPVVVDETLGASTALDVRGWPVVLVLRSDGLEVARVSGSPDVLSMKLGPYLELAAGVKRAPATNVSEDLSKRTARALRLVSTLLRHGDAERALPRIDEALRADPKSFELKAARAEALLMLNRNAEAVVLLRSIPGGALPPVRDATLRARAAIAINQWALARQLTEAALKTHPSDAQLHYLLGTICEHEQDWAGAAAHYRAASQIEQTGAR